MRRILLDISYALRTRNFWIAVILSAAAFLETALAEGSGDLLLLYQMSMSYGIFLIVAPCIAVLPNVRELSSYKGSIMKYNLLRCGTGRYIIEQAISSSIVGGLALMAGPALSLALLSFKFPIVSESFFYVYMAAPEYNASFSNLVRAQHYYLYLCAKLLMVFMFGATMNMIAFAVSTCTKESFVIAFTPFILIQSTTNLTNRAGTVFVRPAIYLHGNLVNLPFDNTCGFLGFVILVHLIIALICLAVSNCILRRRLKYA